MPTVDQQPFTPRQTNTGLYVQLHEAGYSTDDLLAVQKAYRLSARLFNGRYRKTERAFLCHAVGAASSVANFDQRLPMVLTAMLHAAYDSGQFPDGRIGKPSPSHRKWIAQHVGSEVESFVFRYNKFDFELGAPERYMASGFDQADRDCLLIALAHEIDDMADGGLVFAPKYGKSIASRVEASAALADRIDEPELAETLRAHGLRYNDVSWANELQVEVLHGYHIAPNLSAYFRLRRGHHRGKHVILH